MGGGGGGGGGAKGHLGAAKNDRYALACREKGLWGADVGDKEGVRASYWNKAKQKKVEGLRKAQKQK